MKSGFGVRQMSNPSGQETQCASFVVLTRRFCHFAEIHPAKNRCETVCNIAGQRNITKKGSYRQPPGVTLWVVCEIG